MKAQHINFYNAHMSLINFEVMTSVYSLFHYSV